MAITWGADPDIWGNYPEPDPDPATVIFAAARTGPPRHAPRRSRRRPWFRHPGRHTRKAVPAWR
jgi:hypothetical protein